ncbi:MULTISPECIES: MFS transporter [unclassified Pseudomonas]|uniref:MFS transporter n=1 Tax=unclassified Pseudomonas TaxID=196821 RepID=UPI001296CC46|nr:MULTISPECIES: MFS transporter [unclassified Pseudomonas]MDU7557224.1 MFS transporter [Pseudomonas sp.]MQT43168.1 MFS transporter [Pseudomonas sp. FSL R10-0765]MQT53908.1 MFS transporter [Pseudomonas sp. FSL R10-2398]MQU03672.1 MFS transporter [Pseudomonas sp. FSL R10-2245]MQU14266.1 MFS transporter [Pseudomonas sp. FSL R10-2189]
MSNGVCDVVTDARVGNEADLEPATPAWMAVFSLAMGVFGLLTAEYLPASLLTPMAAELGVSEALAGQAVTVTAVAALFSGLLLPGLTRGIDRRVVLLGFSVLMIASNLLVAFSSSLIVLLIMRILLGIALGGFWSMAAAVAMRLVPPTLLPRALSIIFSGIAVGTVVAVPLGSYLGGLYGWRSAFVAAAAVGVVTLVFQLFTLPPLAPRRPARLSTVLEVLLRPGIAVGMLACVLVHTGHFALFTYIRPFLESTSGVGAEGLALMLLGFGAANFVGTLLAGWLLEKSPRGTMVLMPALVGVAALALVWLPASVPGQVVLLALWGMAFGGVPVAWSNWVARAVPDQAESAGGMVVASVQSAIAAGAAAGGAMFSFSDIDGVFVAAGILMLLAALLIGMRVKVQAPGHGAGKSPGLHL